MRFSIKHFFSKSDRRKVRIWSHVLKESLIDNFIFCAVRVSNICIEYREISMGPGASPGPPAAF